ncbi:alpha/beta fold hydrolase [Streptomyces sp. NPDC054933]
MTTPTAQRTLTLCPGLVLTVRESGTGSPVLLLHGGAGPDSITTLADHLAARHRVIAPVHPGWDDRQRPEQLGSVADLADAYLSLLDHLDCGPAAVLGSSFGGWIATEMALRSHDRRIDRFGGWIATEMALRSHDQRIDRLILMNAIGPAVLSHPVAMPGQARSGPDQQAQTRTESGQSTSPRRGPSPAALAALRAYAGPDMQDPDLLPRLKSIQLPVLVVWGENDPVVSPAYGRAYASAFSHARFALVQGAGHIPTREQPETTFAILDRFLNRPTSLPAN